MKHSGEKRPMNTNCLKELVKRSFNALLENPSFDPSHFEEYFSKDYIQYVDGKTMDYVGLLEYAKTLKSRVEDIKISYEHLIAEGNKVCSIHIVEAVRDMQPIKMKIFSLFEFKNNKIIMCDELTHLVLGDVSDRNLGSV